MVSLAERLKSHLALAPKPDSEILRGFVQPEDEGKDFLIGDNCYSWYFSIGSLLKPRFIGEIGVRYGYSLVAIKLGMYLESHQYSWLYGFDDETDIPGSFRIAGDNLLRLNKSVVNLSKVDTQSVNCLENIGANVFNVFHIDGRHVPSSCPLHDMSLAWEVLAPGGLMIVDDYHHCKDVAHAVDQFALEKDIEVEVLPSLRGLAAMWKT